MNSNKSWRSVQALAARQLFASLSLTLAMSGAACSGPSGGMDVPLGMSDALVFPEVSIDVPGTRLYFQRCRENADCPGVAPNGAREICDRSFPGGMCRVVSCADNAPCGPLGVCARQRGCLPRCDLNSDLCTAYSGLCLSFNLPAAENAACFSVCDPAVPGEPADSRIPVEMGPRRCRGGLRCGLYDDAATELAPRLDGTSRIIAACRPGTLPASPPMRAARCATTRWPPPSSPC